MIKSHKLKKTKIVCFFLALIFVLPSCVSQEQIKDESSSETTSVNEIIETENSDWLDALVKFGSESSLLPLLDYADSHPDSVYFSEAERLIKKIQNDSSYSEKYFKAPDLDSLDRFILNFPGHKDTEKALELREDFIGDIFSMLEKEYIDSWALGDSMNRSRIVIINSTKSRLEITVPLGVYLAANSGYVHNMIVLEKKTFTVAPEKYVISYINTASVNLYKDIHEETSGFWLNKPEDDSRLLKLAKVLNENGSSYEVAQAAIWYMMDNPGKNKILAELEYDDGTKAITEEDYDEAVRLVETAGIIHE